MSLCLTLPIVLIFTIIQSNAEDYEVDHTNYGYKTGYFQIFNYWHEDLIVDKVSHLVGNDALNGQGTILYSIPIKAHDYSSVYKFYYKNGLLAGFDYWYMKVSQGRSTWDTKSNFWCNVDKEDGNGTVSLIINMESKKLEVVPPKSSSCKVRLS